MRTNKGFGEAPADRWRSRPALAAAVSVTAFVVPVCLAIASATATAHLLPRPHGVGATLGWWTAVLAVPTAVLMVTERLARRALPLAVLLKMTMVFPDRAPKRLAVARRAASTRDLARRVEQARTMGIEGEPVRAAAGILSLAGALNAHDRRTRGHAERVRAFTDLIADELDLPTADRDRLRWSALLHDIGKLAVHPDILNKPGALDDAEWEVMRNHPLEGAKLTAALTPWLGPWADTIAEHHEKFDGTGYPHQLRGEEISLGGRIVAVADCYDTMTATRSYKRPMSPEAARAELAACAGAHFDPRVVRAFLDVSVGKMRAVAGPIAWVGSLPFVSGVPGLGQVVASLARVGAAAVTVAGAVTVGVVHRSGPVTPTSHGVALSESRLGSVPGGPTTATGSTLHHGQGNATTNGQAGDSGKGGRHGTVSSGDGGTGGSSSSGTSGAPSGAGTGVGTTGDTGTAGTENAGTGNTGSGGSSGTGTSGTGGGSGSGSSGSSGSGGGSSAHAPSAPSAVVATAGSGQATVTWSAPSNGGSAITSYTVTAMVGGVAQASHTFASSATTQVVTGLTDGSAYTFVVVATNAVGSGPASPASAAVTPLAATLTIRNGGTQAGRAEQGDQIVVSFFPVPAPGALCAGWSTASHPELLGPNVVVSADQPSSGDDTVTVTDTADCSGGFHLGSIDLGQRGYFTGSTSFGGATLLCNGLLNLTGCSSIQWDGVRTLTITLGQDTTTQPVQAATSTAVLTPDPALGLPGTVSGTKEENF